MADQTRQTNAWPLILTYRGNVFGHRYIASVSSVSRVLGIQEDDRIWLSGVQPGGIAAGGTDVWEACAAYRKAFVGVLADIASSVGDLPSFQAEAARMRTIVAAWKLTPPVCAPKKVESAMSRIVSFPVISRDANARTCHEPCLTISSTKRGQHGVRDSYHLTSIFEFIDDSLSQEERGQV